MSKKKAKKEKVEYYTLRPNLKQIYGKKVTKETKFEDKTEDGSVVQTFENLTLTTIVKNEYERGSIKVKEESKMVVEVPENTILIWDEKAGFIIPQYQMCTLDELKEEVEEMKEIYKQ